MSAVKKGLLTNSSTDPESELIETLKFKLQFTTEMKFSFWMFLAEMHVLEFPT